MEQDDLKMYGVRGYTLYEYEKATRKHYNTSLFRVGEKGIRTLLLSPYSTLIAMIVVRGQRTGSDASGGEAFWGNCCMSRRAWAIEGQ